MTSTGILLFEKYRAHPLLPVRNARIDSFQRVADLRCMLMRQLDNTASSHAFANG
jgi:hypothetical protein